MKVYRSVHLIFGGNWRGRRTGCPFIHPWECVLSEDCVWTPVVSVGMRKQQCEADELVTRKNEELAVTLHLSTELEVQVTSMSYDSQPLQCRSVLQPKPAETRVTEQMWLFNWRHTNSSDSRAWIHVCRSVRFTRHDDLQWLPFRTCCDFIIIYELEVELFTHLVCGCLDYKWHT